MLEGSGRLSRPMRSSMRSRFAWAMGSAVCATAVHCACAHADPAAPSSPPSPGVDETCAPVFDVAEFAQGTTFDSRSNVIATQLSFVLEHGCALTATGTVYCWGQ